MPQTVLCDSVIGKNRKKRGQLWLFRSKNVKKVYTTRFGTNKVEALKNVNFTAEKG